MRDLQITASDCVWAADGDWESGCLESVQDANTMTRGQAGDAFAREMGLDLLSVRVWKRYCRLATRQESWLSWHSGPVPDDWEPGEHDAFWHFTHRNDPDGIPVWVCGVKGDKPPPKPPSPVRGSGETEQ